jgi:biopolymer transport protein ExbB/TolQ
MTSNPQPTVQLLASDFEPHTLRWLGIGLASGLLLLLLTAAPVAPLHALLHQRGPTQAPAVIAGCMVISFASLKLNRLQAEWRWIRQRPAITLLSLDRNAIEESLRLNSRVPGVLSRRFRALLDLWSETGSSPKVLDALEADTERFDLAQQASFTLPRMLAWGIPILGFLGTVIGIGASVGQFDGLLSDVQDIDNLRRGLTQVTAGLGTAFDTTLLALSISLIVALPLTLVERQEQQLLSLIDQILRTSITPVLPDPNTLGSAVDRRTLEVVISEAFRQLEPLQITTERQTDKEGSFELALESARLTAREMLNELKQLPAFHHNSSPVESIDVEQVVSLAQTTAQELTQALHDHLSATSEAPTLELDLQPLLLALRDQGDQTRDAVLQLLPALKQVQSLLLKQSIVTASDSSRSDATAPASDAPVAPTGVEASFDLGMIQELNAQLERSITRDNATLLNALVELQQVINQNAAVSRENDQEQMGLLLKQLEQQHAESNRLHATLTETISSRLGETGREAQQVIEQAQQRLTRGFSSEFRLVIDALTGELKTLNQSMLGELHHIQDLQKQIGNNAKDSEALWDAARNDLNSTLNQLHQALTHDLAVALEQGVAQLSEELQRNNQQEILQQLSDLMATMQATLTALNRPRRVMLMESQDGEVLG